MADRQRSEIINEHPIGSDLEDFHVVFNQICEESGVFPAPGALDQLENKDLEDLTVLLLVILEDHPITDQLPSKMNHGALRNDIIKLISAISSKHLEFECIQPLLDAVLTGKPDSKVWDEVYNAVTESTPHPQQICLSLPQPSLRFNTSRFLYSSEYVNDVLKDEVGLLYVGLRDFHEKFFGGVPGLERVSEAFFEHCVKDINPFFDDGWRGWPNVANRDAMLSWLSNFCEKLIEFAENHASFSTHQRKLLAKSEDPIDGDIEHRKMDIGFVNNQKAKKDFRCHWSKILVPGELESYSFADRGSWAWFDLGENAMKVLAAQETRRFVLGFTICGSRMRVWEFDRLGGIASDQFDINVDGLRFVATILGFLSMSKEQLGFDPTIMTSKSEQYIEIERNGSQERLILDKLIRRTPCIGGRATTCWKAHREGDAQTPLIIKDSWQYTERDEEGELLQEATDKGVVNVARYYYHETVRVSGKEDNVRDNVRKGMDVTKAVDFQSKCSITSSSMTANARSGNRSTSTTSRERSASDLDASPTKEDNIILPNRVHRRVILRDYGKPIYEASSPVALLTALEGCIEGYESLYDAGFLHRDISINNLMINEDHNNHSWPSFLIDLDFALRTSQEDVSGANTRAGTLPFMAIGVLRGKPHSILDDLESFFWVLFWICIHYTGPGPEHERVVTQFDSWNYTNMDKLAREKHGVISNEDNFQEIMDKYFTEYYSVLQPYVHALRKKVFSLN